MELHNIIKKTNDIIAGSTEAFVATVSDDGFPHVSQRSLIKPARFDELYFSGAKQGELFKRLSENNKVSLSFNDSKNNITLIGRAEEVTQGPRKRELWLDWFSNHYPGGPEGPEFAPFRFTTERVSLWVDYTSYHGGIDELVAFASR